MAAASPPNPEPMTIARGVVIAKYRSQEAVCAASARRRSR